MELRVETSAGEDLLEWLTADPEVSRSTEIVQRAASRPGSMGGGFDLLNLVLSNTIALTGVVVSIASFLESRKRGTGEAPTVNITCQTIVVSVEGDGQEALQRLTALLQGQDSSQAPHAARDGEPVDE
jgi:hypothetical protein